MSHSFAQWSFFFSCRTFAHVGIQSLERLKNVRSAPAGVCLLNRGLFGLSSSCDLTFVLEGKISYLNMQPFSVVACRYRIV